MLGRAHALPSRVRRAERAPPARCLRWLPRWPHRIRTRTERVTRCRRPNSGDGHHGLREREEDLARRADPALPRPCAPFRGRSEEHTSELQSRPHLVCRLLLEKNKKNKNHLYYIKKKKKKI